MAGIIEKYPNDINKSILDICPKNKLKPPHKKTSENIKSILQSFSLSSRTIQFYIVINHIIIINHLYCLNFYK